MSTSVKPSPERYITGENSESASKVFADLRCLAFLSTIASAGTASYSYNFGPTPVSGSIAPAVSTLPKFDDNLLGPGESLVSILFTLGVTNTVSASATNGVLTCDAFGCTPGPSLTLNSLGGATPVSVSGPSSLSTGSTPTPTQNYPGGTPVLNIFSTMVLCLLQAGGVELRSGEVGLARRDFEDAQTFSRRGYDADGKDARYAAFLATSLEGLGACARHDRDWNGAAGWYQKAVDVWKEWSRRGVSGKYDQDHLRQAQGLLEECVRRR